MRQNSKNLNLIILDYNCSNIVSEQKLGIFSKVKEGENYNHPA